MICFAIAIEEMVDGILSTILIILILNNRNLDFNSSSVISIVNRKSVNRKSTM